MSAGRLTLHAHAYTLAAAAVSCARCRPFPLVLSPLCFICMHTQLPPGASKRDIALSLKPDRLGVSYKGEALLEGELYGSVRSWENGSFWELTKEKDHMVGS